MQIRFATAALILALGALALLAPAALAAPGDIATVAGNGTPGSAGESVPATTAELNQPHGIAPTLDGGFLIADPLNHRIRKVSAGGIITTVAGVGSAGFSGDTGPATSAHLNFPTAVATTPDGGFLIADFSNHRIRKVSPGGTITTVAGNGGPGFSGDTGPAVSAQLNFPYGVAATEDGGFLIADRENHRIRKVSAGGTITTVAGSGSNVSSGDGGAASAAGINTPTAASPTADGGFLIAEVTGNRVRKVTPGGTITTVAGTGVAGFSGDSGPATSAQLSQPHTVTAISGGGFLISDSANQRIRYVAPSGIITTFAGVGTPGFSGDGGPATLAELNTPLAVTEASDGSILIVDTQNHRIRRVERTAVTPPVGTVTPKGCVADLTSGDTSCTQTVNGQSLPRAVAVSPDGTSVYAVAQSYSAIVRFNRNPSTGAITPQGCIDDLTGPDTCAASTEGLGGAYGVAVSPDGEWVYATGSADDAIVLFDRNVGTGALTPAGCVGDDDTGPVACTTASPGLDDPRGVAISTDGTSLYAVSRVDNAITRFDRNIGTGALTPQGCVEDTDSGPDSCGATAEGLGGAEVVAVSPDDLSVYSASFTDDAVTRFDRAPGGALTAQGCISDLDNGDAGCAPQFSGMTALTSIAVSPEGNSVYVAASSSNSVTRFDRATPSGALTHQGCISDDDTGSLACSQQTSALNSASGVVVAPDGGNVYVASRLDDAVVTLARNTGTGAITPSGCFDEVEAGQGPDGCAGGTDGLDGAFALAASPDGLSVYAVSTVDHAVVRFDRVAAADVDPPETQIDSGPSGLTNDNPVDFTFSSDEPGSTFECSVDTGTPSWGPCTGPGAYTAIVAPDGAYTFRVRATDPALNVDPTPATQAFTLDTTPPNTALDSGPSGLTNDTTPTFTFSSPEPGATFQCSIDTGTPSYTACSGAGTHTPAAPLTDGTYTFRVQAVDAATNADLTPATSTFTVDTAAPTSTINTEPPSPTNDPTPTFTFSTSEPGSAFQCSVDTGTPSFGACSGAGTHTPAAPLTDGTYTFRVRSTDAATNTGAADTTTLTVDTAAPTSTINTEPPSPTNDSTPTFTFSTSEPGSAFQCSVDTGTPSFGACSGAGTHTPAAPLTDGTYTFRVRSTDAATNLGAPDATSFTVDTDPPDTVINAGPTGNTDDPTPTFTFAADEPGAGLQCSIDAGTPSFGPCSGPGTHTPAAALPDGPYTFRVRATDTAGNAEAAPATRAFTVSTAPPPPTPSNGDTLVAGRASGVVKVKEPGSGRYVILLDGEEIPVGTRVDATKGKVLITSISPQGVVQSSLFYAGRFQVLQRDGSALVTLKLEGGNFKRCPKPRRGGAAGKPLAAAATVRKLWGRGRGRFQTRGRGGAGTVRGTEWLTADRCDGTFFKVRKGVVGVRDFGRRKTVTVRAGRQYLARLR